MSDFPADHLPERTTRFSAEPPLGIDPAKRYTAVISTSKGDMTVAIPHQDVLIVGDLRNSAGYNVMGQLAMKFYSEGQIPITPMPMVVEADRELTPILVMPETIKQKKTFRRGQKRD